ncbi:MAG: ABC transporter permease, partial [Planctomycetota bacterium]|nr:ABC transporter permease [Planctomycetota bacterium]
MTILRLIFRGLLYHRRMHATVGAGVAVAVAAIVGALVLGDCVRGTLRRTLLDRLGGVQAVVEAGPRFFRADLADEVAASTGAPAAAAIELTGAAVNGLVRANRVRVYGVDERAWQLLDYPGSPPQADAVVINQALANKLGARAGQEIQLLLPHPSAVGGETPLPGQGPETLRPRVTVAAVAPGADFSLRAQQGRPLTVFVSRVWLTERLDLARRANLLLTASTNARAADRALRASLQGADLQLTLRPVPGTGDVEVRSDAVFLPPPVEQALDAGDLKGHGAMAYFLNRLVAGDRTSPYAVAAGLPPGTGPVPADLKDDEFVPNAWLVEDLALTVGQAVSFEYF